jgi:hypothetical protein
MAWPWHVLGTKYHQIMGIKANRFFTGLQNCFMLHSVNVELHLTTASQPEPHGTLESIEVEDMFLLCRIES